MSDQALLSLGNSTAEAMAGVLRGFCADAAESGDVAVVPGGTNPFGLVSTPAVLSSVAFVDGVTGGNVFAIGVAGARRLAAAMAGKDPQALDEGAAITELELSAMGEVMNQMMAATAAATGAVLGHEVDIDPPRTEVVESFDDALDLEQEAHVVSASFTVFGEPARLVQVVPPAFLVRLRRALDEGGAPEAGVQPAGAGAGAVPEGVLRDVRLRVWAEIGRARMQMARAVAMEPGAIVELDREADAPVDLYVNGRRFAAGRLLKVDGGDWAVRIESIGAAPAVPEA